MAASADQWFPEVARAMVLQGAEILLYPSAIGSDLTVCDKATHSDQLWLILIRIRQEIQNPIGIVSFKAMRLPIWCPSSPPIGSCCISLLFIGSNSILVLVQKETLHFMAHPSLLDPQENC